jgi:Tol biopolymer transport system component
MRSDGTGARRVTSIGTEPHGAFYPAWSPDGRLIAFATGGPTLENEEIYAVRPDDMAVRRLTFTVSEQ